MFRILNKARPGLRYCAVLVMLYGCALVSEAEPNRSWQSGPQAFELKSGAGTPVCDAYLAMLRSLEFERPPFCGRPPLADGHASGFEPLAWKRLSFDEEYALAQVAPGYFSAGRPDSLQKVWAERERISALKPSSNTPSTRSPYREELLAGVRQDVERSQRDPLSTDRAYEIASLVDIDNDGKLDRLAVLPDGPNTCGAVRIQEPEATGNHAVVLDHEGGFDFRRTDEVFRDTRPYRIPAGPAGSATRRWIFLAMPRYLVQSVSITKFRGTYFFDGLMPWADQGEPAQAGKKALSTISVFEHKAGITHLRCEIDWLGSSTPGRPSPLLMKAIPSHAVTLATSCPLPTSWPRISARAFTWNCCKSCRRPG